MAEGLMLKSGGGGGLDPEELTTLPEHVLLGKKFGGSGSDEPQTGTMPDRGAITKALNGGEAYTIPVGYHNGAGKVTANSLSGQTAGTASAGHILSGQTAWVNGNRITGSMPNRGNISQSLAVNGSYTIPAGYHAGGGRISQSVATQGAQTITPGTAAKTIAANRYLTGVQTIAGDGNLAAGNIKKGVTIFGITGTHSGYVVGTEDLYNRGAIGNGAEFNGKFVQHNHGGRMEGLNQYGSLTMDVGCMVLKRNNNDGSYVAPENAINLTGYNKINVEFEGNCNDPERPNNLWARMYLSETLLAPSGTINTELIYTHVGFAANTITIASLPVSQFPRKLFFHFGTTSMVVDWVNIYRIWIE